MATKPPAFIGVESSKDVARLIWDNGFAAVAGDAPSFEMAPLSGAHNAPGGIWKGEVWEDEMQGGGLLHQFLLAGWGVMIGEMWDLERLCEVAERTGRRTCFVSSVPLKVSLSLFFVACWLELAQRTRADVPHRRSQEAWRVHRMPLQSSRAWLDRLHSAYMRLQLTSRSADPYILRGAARLPFNCDFTSATQAQTPQEHLT